MSARARRPGGVPDDDGPAAVDIGTEVRFGTDTDGDGAPDTVLADDGPDLLVATDLNGDGLVDRLLRIGPDGSVHRDEQHASGSAPAHSFWTDLLGADPGTVGGPG